MVQAHQSMTVQEAKANAMHAFHERPMPLSACLELRRIFAEQQAPSDSLMPIPGETVGWGGQLKDPKLQSMLDGVRLGEWTLDVETIEFLSEKIQTSQPRAILEFGSGVSTIILAQAMADIYPVTPFPVVLSIEQDATHVQQTTIQLERYGLARFVKILHAPLGPQILHHISTNCYQVSDSELQKFFGQVQIDFVLIDGPAADYGERIGTIPLVQEFLEPGAAVYMDDGLRDSELAIAEWWNQYGYVDVEGILCIGKGVMVGRYSRQPISQISQSRHVLTWLGRYSQDATSKRILSLPTRFVEEKRSDSFDGVSYSREASRVERGKSLQTGIPRYRCLFLNTYYAGFLDAHYSKTSESACQSYQRQKDALQSECFGDSDFYSEGLKKQGWDAQDLIVNCEILQQSWALEQNFSGEGLEIAVEQIRQLTPDVIYLQDLHLATPAFLAAIRPLTTLIVGQIASKVPPQIDLQAFDILFSSFPHFVKEFRKQGVMAYYQPLAFDPRVLQKEKPLERKHQVTFVGTLSADHSLRMEFLEQLQAHVPFDCWGYQISPLVNGSRMQRQYHGEAWGGEMFSRLQESFMTLNYHVDIAGQFANNMRIFEATGCGALLMTDYKDNLQELFDIGREVVAYRSLEECADLIRFYLHHQDEARQIAKAGQARTLRDHTYDIRMAQTAEILERHLRYQGESLRALSPDMSRISYGYEAITKSQVTASMTNAWKNQDIPHKQRVLVQTELQAMYSGKPPLVFQVLADCLRPYVRPHSTILEVGCASGYYYEVLEYLLTKRIVYTGVDYSEPLISMAKRYYVSPQFQVADGANLPFHDEQFHIAISSCILLHVPDYQKHIRETVRVAQQYVVVHRTPICKHTPTQLFKKYAYGVETMELRFNEKEFLEEFCQAGLSLLHAMEYSSAPDADQYDVTYVFRKIS